MTDSPELPVAIGRDRPVAIIYQWFFDLCISAPTNLLQASDIDCSGLLSPDTSIGGKSIH